MLKHTDQMTWKFRDEILSLPARIVPAQGRAFFFLGVAELCFAVYGQCERNNADACNRRGFLFQGFRKIFGEDFAWSKMLFVDHFFVLGKQRVISVGKTDQWYFKDRITVEGVQPIEGTCTHKLFYDLLDESIRI